MKTNIIKNAGLNAVLSVLYISLIGSFLFYTPKIFDSEKPDTVFAPILMLSLLVLSVAVMGILIFGKPLLWYMDNRRHDAVSLLAYTLGIFFVITLIISMALYFTL